MSWGSIMSVCLVFGSYRRMVLLTEPLRPHLDSVGMLVFLATYRPLRKPSDFKLPPPAPENCTQFVRRRVGVGVDTTRVRVYVTVKLN